MGSTYHVCCRIAGHVTMLYFLTVPLLEMNDLIEQHSAINPDVKMFAALRTRFATVWNVCFQLFYASLALLIDVYALRGMENKIPAALRNYRYIFYAGIIFPVVCGVQMFWIVYFYDKELVFKKTLEVVISEKVNFIVHTLVSIYALWELVFLPRDQPKRNDASWMHVFVFNVLYVAVIFYTRYVDIGVWTYEVQTVTVGSIMFLVILFSIWTLSTIGYYFQFQLKDFVWWCRDGFCTKKKVF